LICNKYKTLLHNISTVCLAKTKVLFTHFIAESQESEVNSFAGCPFGLPLRNALQFITQRESGKRVSIRGKGVGAAFLMAISPHMCN